MAPRRDSQFAGAAALFQQKEKEILDKQPSPSQFAGAAAVFQKKEKKMLAKNQSPGPSPRSSLISPRRRGNSSMTDLGFSPPAQARKSVSHLQAPPFVSPGLAQSKPAWQSSRNFPTSSYLDKPMGTTTPVHSKPKLEVSGFAFSPTSPSPGAQGKPKVDGKSWKDSISFQASSPVGVKNKVKPTSPKDQYAMSYIDNTPPKKKRQDFDALPETPDIKIEVKIPDIDRKIRERKAQKSKRVQEEKKEDVPEWKQKYQQREENRIRRENERQASAAEKIQAYMLGWKARAAYPRLLEENADRLNLIRERERRIKLRLKAAIKIQSIWRMYLPRVRYLYVRECKRRRERNKKEIKRIEKVLSKWPKETKTLVKNMKKEYAEKKKQIKKDIKKELKEEGKRLDAIKKSGQDMIEYMRAENQKLKDRQEGIRKEHKVLEKQTELLAEKSGEIAKMFTSLQGYVQKKSASVQKHEINSQKCRHRYLPKYRAMLKDRDKHCIAENHIASMYKRRLDEIIQLLNEKPTSRSLAAEAQMLVLECENELEGLDDIPIPEGLEGRIRK
eukprot:Nitzschia sp. Nitz4//scaffold16_size188269//157649//159613//NITZ4_001814-RA/size188269-snap-gene-0.128-mRNA-1//1//CDS//3329538586//5453//frame0